MIEQQIILDDFETSTAYKINIQITQITGHFDTLSV